MTYMWQEEKGKPYYRFQTDEQSIAKKMTRRKKFILSAVGYNCPIWVFKTEISRPSVAKNMLKTLTGKTLNFNKKEDIYYC